MKKQQQQRQIVYIRKIDINGIVDESQWLAVDSDFVMGNCKRSLFFAMEFWIYHDIIGE